MSRIPAKELAYYPWWLRVVLWLQKRKYGAALSPALLWGRSPSLFASVTFFFRSLERKSSPLPPVLRALVTVRVSQINHCSYCVDINSARVLEQGGPREKLSMLGQSADSELFDEQEKTALALAECITTTGCRIEPELWRKASACFSEDAIIELIGLIAFQNLSSKFNAALDVEAQGFCMMPDK